MQNTVTRIWTGTGEYGALWGGAFGFGLESIASTVQGNDLCMMKQSLEDGAGGGHIAEQFTPFFDGTIGGHHGRTVLVTTHDNFQ